MKQLLSVPIVFDLFNTILGEKRGRAIFVNHYVKPTPGVKILDIGCGTGSILKFMKDVDYDGYDASQKYIDEAKNKFGKRGNFYCERVESCTLLKTDYDVVIASGLIHHLNGESTARLFSTAKQALRNNGKFITIDNVLTDSQNIISRLIIKQDRGRFIRSEKEYKSLFKDEFPNTIFDIRSDLLRIPYTHIIAVAMNDGSAKSR